MTPKPPPTPPTKATRAARSGSESARGKGTTKRKAGQPYPEATKAKALAMLKADGMAEAHRRTKVPKATLSRWARAAGVDLGEQARQRTAAATEAVRARAAEVTASTVDLLEQHIAQAGDYLATVAGVNALAARYIAAADPDTLVEDVGIAGPYVRIADPQAQELAKVALALGSLPLAVRDAEGLVTRAIHDLQLLRGEATERGELLVEFNVPRPTAAPEGDVLEIDTPDD